MITYALLRVLKLASGWLYRHDWAFVGHVPDDPWRGIRLIVMLNHTSLYESLFVGAAPNTFLKEIARSAVVPVADKTMRRPIVGRVLGWLVHRAVPITRRRDETWSRVLDAMSADEHAIMVIFPEGRMLRPTGLDADGQPLRVRGGVADPIAGIAQGRVLLAYSGGLHHVQVPGQAVPRVFQPLRIRLEVLELDAYRRSIPAAPGADEFRQQVIQDLEARKHACCPA